MDDSKHLIVTEIGSFTLERLTNEYIVEGSTVDEISKKYSLPVQTVRHLIESNDLDKLRAAHIKHGLAALQNVQLVQAEKLMSLENQFKRIRIIQLEKMLEDYMAYYSKFGHFYKIHPVTQEVLKDMNGIPMQIKIPNVSKEISELKEGVSLSEGLKALLGQIDEIINPVSRNVQTIDPNVIDMSGFDGLFEKKKSEDFD